MRTKMRVALWGVAFLLVFGVVWRLAVPGELRERAWEPVRAEGERQLVGEPPQKQYAIWPGYTVRPSAAQRKRMAKCPIESGLYSASWDLCFFVVPGDDQAGISGITMNIAKLFFVDYYAGGYIFTLAIETWPVVPEPVCTVHIPYAVGAPQKSVLHWEFSSDSAMLEVTSSTQIIGEKANPTHAKEHIINEAWYSPEDATTAWRVTGVANAELGNYVGGVWVPLAGNVLTGIAGTTLLQVGFGGEFDPDLWGHCGKYAVSFEKMKFCGEVVDLSAATPRVWHETPEGYYMGGVLSGLWLEGTADGTLGLWGPNYQAGPYVMTPWPGGAISAPYNFDFSPMSCLWMDGSPVDDALEVYCTGLRNLNSSGVDIGNWHGTLAALKALGRVKQKYGLHSWDTWEPDLQATVELYLDLTSAEALGIEVRGPQPAFKVEGAGWSGGTAWTEGYVSPYDGAYAPYGTHNGEPVYSNGYAFLYCTDPAGPDWGIGPGPPTDPYYIQEGGGPAGAYLVNIASYNDNVIYEETGQRQFSGLFGAGLGPAVSANTSEAISVDSDCAVRSFQHDATFIFDAWPLDAPSRTGSPYMTDVVRIAADSAKSAYADAHDHTDWVGVNCSTPDSGGYFTVGAGGGSLTLTLKCNYRARQALVGGVDEIPVPTAYLNRRHDLHLGEGTVPETAEAVWDWRGRYLTQAFVLPSVPADVVCTITYYDDLLGVGDNHKTDSTRQTEYTYSAGDLHTLARTIPVSYAVLSSGEMWSSILVDLYDEQNGHPVAMAVTLKWDFPAEAAGVCRMTAPTVTPDMDDRQEITATTPFYREAPSTAGMALKADESWRYAQAVVSAHFNGLCDRVLFVPDNAKACVVEKCFDTLNVLIGAKTGVDRTSNYPLSGWPVTNSGEAWTLTHSPTAEAAHMKDADDVTLKALQCLDIAPGMSLGPQGAGTSFAIPVAVRCFRVVAVNGLPYTFHGTKYVGGRGHGMTLKVNPPNDFPRSRGTGAGKLYRQPLGAAPEVWQVVDTLTADAHGHWESSAQAISDTNAARTLWEFKTNLTEMGRFATREFALGEAEPYVGQRLLCVDQFGNIFAIYAKLDGSHAVAYRIRRWLREKWEPEQIAATLAADPDLLEAEKDGRGVLRVTYADGDTGNLSVLYSHDSLNTVGTTDMGVALNWTNVKSFGAGPYRYFLGYDGAYWNCARAPFAGGALVPFGDEAQTVQIAAGADDVAGFTGAADTLVADLPQGGGAFTTYYSEDCGESWHQAT